MLKLARFKLIGYFCIVNRKTGGKRRTDVDRRTTQKLNLKKGIQLWYKIHSF